jgi:hypothetical protein
MEFIKRARDIDKKDVELIYAEATVEMLAKKPADALRTLREAVSQGYPIKQVLDDPEFAELSKTPEFQALVKEYSKGTH